MLCIAAMMTMALIVSYMVGFDGLNFWVGLMASLVLMWGAFKLINALPEKEEKK